MSATPLNLLLADDDSDDCFLFIEVLKEIPVVVNLTTVHDGVQLMQLLSAKETPLPDALFLDLNMPRKGGFECLAEIKMIDRLKDLPVIIYSTSLDMEVVDLLYQKRAYYYICKPAEYNKLKIVLSKAITLIAQNNLTQPPRTKFILEP